MESRFAKNDAVNRSTDGNAHEESTQNAEYGRSSLRSNNEGNGNEPQNGSFGFSSNMGDSSWRRNSLSFSTRVTPQVFDEDIESEVVSQAGDIGDRQLSSRRHSGSGRLRLSVDKLTSNESGVLPITEESYLQTYGQQSQDNSASPLSQFPSELVSPLSTDAIFPSNDKNPNGLAHPSSQHVKVNKKELPQSLEYISCLVHLAVFGILGVLTRYLLQKLFGPSIAGVTSDQSALYLDLPSNVLGSFLMGWFGVVFKGDISRTSDLLAIGLTTGYLGSLTTFSGWNQKMLDLSVKGRWVVATVGILLGMFIVAESIRVGVETAKGFRWILKKLLKSSKGDTFNTRNECMIDNLNRHLAVLVTLLVILGLLWGVSGALLRRRIDGENTNDQIWLACIVAPFGVWARWLLARLNGRGIGSKGLMKWIPFGTLIANVSAACMMAALSTVKKDVNTKKCNIIATGIQFGLLGCLSTVSTFIAEFHAMRQSTHPWRAYVYGTVTILPSFILGTLIYSVPVWIKGY